jgi:Ser/Thr protein kinase RdoA (MazF antagonist)
MSLDNYTVEDIAKESIGRRPKLVEEAPSGLVHETFILRYSEDDFVLQVAEADEQRVWALERNCEIFSWETQLPIPNLEKDIEEAKIGEDTRKFYIAERLSGKILQKSFNEGMAEDIGGKLGEFHCLKEFDEAGGLARTKDGFEVKQFEEGSFRDWLLGNISEDIEILEDAGLENIADEIRAFFREHSQKLSTNFNPVLCHNDYSPDNILARGGEITGIIDFDFVISADPRRDLVKAANSFWIEGFEVRKEIYEGYRKEKSLKNFGQVEPVYRLETLLRIIASLFELNEGLGKEEREVYRKKLEDTIEYCRKSYSRQ